LRGSSSRDEQNFAYYTFRVNQYPNRNIITTTVQPNLTEVTENAPAQLKAPTEQEAETRETPVQELSTPEQETTGNVINIRAIQEKRRQEIPVVNLGGLSSLEGVS
jgi:hypothetical protein